MMMMIMMMIMVIKSLEPYNKKLGTDTWFYAKRCFLSLAENLSKHMISVRDTVVQVCSMIVIVTPTTPRHGSI